MASRQNREMRAEYPTGHNRGNESPSRRVPRNPGANPVEPPEDVDVKAYGAPMGVPEVDESREAERERKLETEATPEARSEAIETHIEEGREETRQRAETEAANRRTEAAQEEPSPTADLSIGGAIGNIQDIKRRTEEEGRR